ncbi:hypothetical protein [Streptomyces sp. NPDC054834]
MAEAVGAGVAEAVDGAPDGAADVVPGLAERAASSGAPPADAVPPDLTAADVPGSGMPAVAAPEESAGDADRAGAVVSSPAVDAVRLCGASDDPEPDNPAITAARDTTHTAPTATAVRRPRRPAARLRAPRPPAWRRPAGLPTDGSSPTVTGSSRVASYAFCQPWAAAGSAYSSYAGAATADGWYTFGGGTGSRSGCGWAGVDMACDCRYLCGSWDSYRR